MSSLENLTIPGTEGNKFKLLDNKVFVVDEDGTIIGDNQFTTISLYGLPHRKINIQWLIELSTSKLFEVDPDNPEVIFQITFTGDRRNPKAKKIMVSSSPIFVKWSEEPLAYVPGMFGLCVDTTGKIYKIKPGRKLKELNLRDGEVYKFIEYKGNRHYAHRLVALAWCRPKEEKYYHTVRIIDGDTSNLSPYNLQWTCHYITNDVKRLPNGCSEETTIRNIDTGEVKTFPSVTLACEYIGRSRINQEDGDFRLGRVWTGSRGRFEMKFSSNQVPWYYVSKEGDRYKEGNSGELFSYVFCNSKGEVKVYKSYEYLFKDLLPDYALTKDNIANVESILLTKYPGSKFEKRDSRIYQARNILPEGSNGYKHLEVVEENSIQNLANKIGVPKSTVRKYVSLNKVFNGWQMRVTAPGVSLDWPEVVEEKIPDNAPGTYVAINLNTNEEIKFDSKRKLSAFLGVARSSMPTGAEANGSIIKGYKIRFEGCKRVDLSTNNKRSSKKPMSCPQ